MKILLVILFFFSLVSCRYRPLRVSKIIHTEETRKNGDYSSTKSYQYLVLFKHGILTNTGRVKRTITKTKEGKVLEKYFFRTSHRAMDDGNKRQYYKHITFDSTSKRCVIEQRREHWCVKNNCKYLKDNFLLI